MPRRYSYVNASTIAQRPASRLEAKQREQIPQAVARLAIVGLFIAVWGLLWVVRIPMPVPFLLALCAEGVFFVVYLRSVFLIRSARGVQYAHYAMLAAEIVFHTTMVYFLGGASWLGAFAYVFGVIFTNAFLDLKSGFVYTAGAAGAFAALVLLDANGTIPHYVYLEQTGSQHSPRFLITTVLSSSGVFFSVYLWVNWVGHQLRTERDTAVRVQDELMVVRGQLEERVLERTAQLEASHRETFRREEQFRLVLDSALDGVITMDDAGKITHWNPQAALMFGWSESEVMGQTLSELIVPPEFREAHERGLRQYLETGEGPVLNRRVELRARRRHGDEFPAEVSIRPLRTGDNVVFSAFVRDISEQKKAEEVLRNQALHDALTSTLNHASITDALRELSAAAGGVSPIAVVMVDVDGMKAVNDTYGHQVGDEVLVAIAGSLVQDGALVGRYGGDEFLVALPGVSRAAAEAYCAHVLEAVAAARVRDAHTGSLIPVIASMGVAMFPDEAETVEEAIRLADHAMYTAKRERRHLEGALPSRNMLADERAAKMIGEIVPLLTSPGNLEEKLRLVAHRLSIGAGYDVVRFSTSQSGQLDPDATSTFARVADGIVEAWNEETRKSSRDSGNRELMQRTRRPILLDDLEHAGNWSEEQRRLLREVGLKSALLLPMLWQDEMIGVLSVATKSERGIDVRDVQFLSTVATQVSAIIHMEALVEDLQSAAAHLRDARADTVVLLAAAAEAHDHTTGRHLQRVRTITEALATELGYGADDVYTIGLGAVLHDIGKIRVPETILLSPSQLGDEEWELMKQHTKWGAEFLAGRPGFELAATIAAAHHERWDGSGYPLGLAGDAIPEAATIVSVADSLDAMTNDRPYRTGRPVEWAVREIKRCSGQQFSPRIVDALLRLHERQALPLPGDEDLGDEQAA